MRAKKRVTCGVDHAWCPVGGFVRAGPQRLAQDGCVAGIATATGPLVGTRQRRHALRGIEGKGVACPPGVQLVGQVLQLGAEVIPVVEHLLQPVGDVRGIDRLREVAGHQDELPVAGAVEIACKFHGRIFAAKQKRALGTLRPAPQKRLPTVPNRQRARP